MCIRDRRMRIEEAVREVKRWVEKYDYCSNVEVGAAKNLKFVKFSARTTTTRASSMVTRIKHIVQDAVDGRGFGVSKELVGLPPETRADLASWAITVVLPLRVVRR